jgi:16S rRNA (cytidine1402-2'-O)-methyltransferase
VATPIGNLGDLSPRAVTALAAASCVVCEDTRRTGRLLAHAGITGTRMLVANEHREASCAAEVAKLLDQGATVAVVTDAGTPGISDPGERLVAAAIAGGHDVSVVPGPAAAIAALVISGLPTERFVMEGFLPRSGRERGERVIAVATEPRTIVLYEAPHRLARTLTDLAAACGGDRAVVVAREITKLHEETWRGTLATAVERANQRDPIGEHVIVLAGATAPAPATDATVEEYVRDALARGLSPRDAATEAATTFAIARRHAYDLVQRVRRA